MDEIIPDMGCGTEEKIYVPKNAAHTEFVLIFQIASVAPFQNQHGKQVLSGAHEFSNTEFAGGVGNLAVSHKGTVYPDIEAGIHPFKIQEAFGIRLFLRKFKPPAVGTAGVFFRYIRRIKGEWVAGVGVLVAVVAVILPAARHGNGGIAQCVFFAGFCNKAFRHVFRAAIIAETPVAAA